MSEEHVIAHFTALCWSDADVAAAFLGGSHAAGTADRVSDLDLYVITTDEGYDRFMSRRMEFLRGLGQPVFAEDFSEFGFDMLLFMLEDGTDGELAFARASRFLHIHGGPYRALVDKRGVLAGVEFPLYRPEPEEQRRALRGLLTSFWRDAWHFGKAMGRGRLWDAQGTLERLRRGTINVLRLRRDFTIPAEGYAGVDRLLRPGELSALAPTVGPLDAAALWRAQGVLMGIMHEAGVEVAARQRVDYPAALERVVRARLAALAPDKTR